MTAQSADNRSPWLFSRTLDLSAFLGSALLSAVALLAGRQFGWLADDGDGPEWVWVSAVLLVDVAHVWSTAFRVYLDPDEFRRRAGTYLLVPVIAFLAGVVLYSFGTVVFWRCLAYLAVFHFVRQQYGWVMLYRAKCGEHDRRGRWLDTATIYVAMLYPLAWWHARLPRNYHWFLAGDFTTLPAIIADILRPAFWGLLACYAARSVHRRVADGPTNPGKDIVVGTTAACWYVGIVAFNSDYSFTVTNVFIHGIPYLVLIYWYARLRPTDGPRPAFGHGRAILIFLATIWAIAYTEELLWDRLVWHERPWLFGDNRHVDSLKWVVVPLLAVPQLTHYLLDGLIWRRRTNPGLGLTGS